MAGKKKLRISLIELIYIAYIIRLITGNGLIAIIKDMIEGGGSITDKVLSLALAIFQRIEDEGIEIVVNAAVVTLVKEKVLRPLIGHKKIVDIGFAIVTV